MPYRCGAQRGKVSRTLLSVRALNVVWLIAMPGAAGRPCSATHVACKSLSLARACATPLAKSRSFGRPLACVCLLYTSDAADDM
eukprot:17371-Alexandrium_andersonii.AAC.1